MANRVDSDQTPCSVSSDLPASILYKIIAGRSRPVSYPDGPTTAFYRFIKNTHWAGSTLFAKAYLSQYLGLYGKFLFYCKEIV